MDESTLFLSETSSAWSGVRVHAVGEIETVASLAWDGWRILEGFFWPSRVWSGSSRAAFSSPVWAGCVILSVDACSAMGNAWSFWRSVDRDDDGFEGAGELRRDEEPEDRVPGLRERLLLRELDRGLPVRELDPLVPAERLGSAPEGEPRPPDLDLDR